MIRFWPARPRGWRQSPTTDHLVPAGVSLKTQQLYALVFATRYLDLLFTFISLYNRQEPERPCRTLPSSDAPPPDPCSVMKIVFLGATFKIVHYMMYDKVVRSTYDKEHDSFRSEYIVGPCAVLALLLHSQFNFVEASPPEGVVLRRRAPTPSCPLLQVLWTFSIYLEALAILPQLVVLQRTKNIDNLTGNYVFLLGSYRALYILNWIWRWDDLAGTRARPLPARPFFARAGT